MNLLKHKGPNYTHRIPLLFNYETPTARWLVLCFYFEYYITVESLQIKALFHRRTRRGGGGAGRHCAPPPPQTKKCQCTNSGSNRAEIGYNSGKYSGDLFCFVLFCFVLFCFVLCFACLLVMSKYVVANFRSLHVSRMPIME